MTDPQSLARARAEFDSIKEGESDLERAFKDILTLEKAGELIYMGYCIQEALRLNPVATVTAVLGFKTDT